VYDGSKNFEMAAEHRNLGLVFQSYALWPHKTVFDNVAYGLKLRKLGSSEIKDKVNDVLKKLGLGHLGERFPHQLSGGQQQRVAIARALVYNPPVILLDEPLSNLDAKLREEARAFLRELIVRLGLSALMVTHDQAEAMAISDRILLLNNGKIEQQGTPQSMYETPDTLFTAEFMGSNNRLPAQGGAAQRRAGAARYQRRPAAGDRARRRQRRAVHHHPRGGSEGQPRRRSRTRSVAAVDLHVPGRPLRVPVQERERDRDQPARLFKTPAGPGQLLAATAGR
jgi:ABC-type Fe3+/spermidine/putrescine transport system ATPase subunit